MHGARRPTTGAGAAGQHVPMNKTSLGPMDPFSFGEQRALEVLHRGQGLDAAGLVALLRAEGLRIADARSDELVCRWVSTADRAVPPEADTIIRTITRTLAAQSYTTVHWLDGLRGPTV